MKINFKKLENINNPNDNESEKDVFGYISEMNWDDYIPEISSDTYLWNEPNNMVPWNEK